MQDMNTTKVNRKRRSTELPICQYGASCYRKNPDHRKKFRHPESEVDQQNSASNDSVADVQASIVKESCSEIDSAELTEKNSASNDSVADVQASIVKESCSEIDSAELTEKDSSSENGDFADDSSKPSELMPCFTETVDEILKSMPQDFFDFWNFCTSVNKLKPEDAFAEMGLYLVGTYDLLARKLAKDKKVLLHCHWRFYYDPPEFQTVVKSSENLYHIGYFRDDPDSLPTILASNDASVGAKLTLKGDNIFAAMNLELTERIPKLESKLSHKFSKIRDKLKACAGDKKYSLEIQTPKTRARSKKVVAKTFHGLGIVVPVVNDIGYRELPDSDARVKTILRKIVNAKSEDSRLTEEEFLDELITNVQFANDECDYGMGLELGIDLFCYGETYFHPHIVNLLSIAYDLLKRPKYSEILKFHLSNRKKSNKLNALDD